MAGVSDVGVEVIGEGWVLQCTDSEEALPTSPILR